MILKEKTINIEGNLFLNWINNPFSFLPKQEKTIELKNIYLEKGSKIKIIIEKVE